MPMIKVYNKGVKPIVWSRSLKGIEVIHPRKYDVFSKEKAEEIIKKFQDAVSESDYKKLKEDKKAKK